MPFKSHTIIVSFCFLFDKLFILIFFHSFSMNPTIHSTSHFPPIQDNWLFTSMWRMIMMIVTQKNQKKYSPRNEFFFFSK